MSEKKEHRGLGRGLSALMADIGTPEPVASTATQPRASQTVAIDKLHRNPDQPRIDFDQQELEELAASLSSRGIIQPLIVRVNPNDSNSYQIVAGERRWRAAQIAQIHDVPVVVRDFSDEEVLEVAIIENVQRSDLNPIEEALGLNNLQEQYGHTQEKLASALGKSRSHIANLMRLLQLPEDVQGYLRRGELSAGHARALITAPNPSDLARQVIAKGLSVRATEKLVKTPPKAGRAAPQPREKDADTVALERDLAANLGMKVQIDHKLGDEGGNIRISYSSLEQLDALCGLLSTSPLRLRD